MQGRLLFVEDYAADSPPSLLRSFGAAAPAFAPASLACRAV